MDMHRDSYTGKDIAVVQYDVEALMLLLGDALPCA